MSEQTPASQESNVSPALKGKRKNRTSGTCASELEPPLKKQMISDTPIPEKIFDVNSQEESEELKESQKELSEQENQLDESDSDHPDLSEGGSASRKLSELDYVVIRTAKIKRDLGGESYCRLQLQEVCSAGDDSANQKSIGTVSQVEQSGAIPEQLVGVDGGTPKGGAEPVVVSEQIDTSSGRVLSQSIRSILQSRIPRSTVTAVQRQHGEDGQLPDGSKGLETSQRVTITQTNIGPRSASTNSQAPV